MSLVRPRAILFDWDNTLVDNWLAIHAALNATFGAMNHPPWTLDETKERVRRSLRDSFPAMFGDRWTEAREIFYQTFEAEHLARLRVMGGANEVLAELRSDGIYLGVVSNKTGKLLRREAAHLGWDGIFSKLVGATDAARDKPARDPIDLALEPAGLRAGPHVWYVGDAAIDMACAHAAGCTGVLIGPPNTDLGDFEDCPPAAAISDLNALLALVRTPGKTIC